MSSSPKRQKAGAYELELARQGSEGMEKYNERYAPLQKELNKEAGRDYSGRMTGQGRAGAARAMSQHSAAVGLGGGQLSAGGLTGAGIQGKAAAAGMRTERLGAASQLAAGQQAQNVSSMSSLAQGQANVNSAIHQGKQQVRNAQMNALGTLAGAGASAGIAKYMSRTPGVEQPVNTAAPMQSAANGHSFAPNAFSLNSLAGNADWRRQHL